MTVGLTVWLTLTNMRGKWMKMDKTSRMMAAGDIWEFSNCSLFHHIKLSSPNLQTRRNRHSASAEWAVVSKDQLDACYRKGFCCRSSTFQNAWVLQNEQIVPSFFPASPFPATSPFSFPHAGVEGGGVPEWTVWVMRKISGGDALEVGTVWQEKQRVCER